MPRPHLLVLLALVVLALAACVDQAGQTAPLQSTDEAVASPSPSPPPEPLSNPGKLIHVVVALCDNQFQGIVPVPARIGNGDDPANNLYWGAAFGVKTFFRKANEWSLLAEVPNPKPGVLERLVFKHRAKEIHLVADAYRGREIRLATWDFLRYAAGAGGEPVEVADGASPQRLLAGGGADLVAYVGHDGLMDFTLPEAPRHEDDRQRQTIILACASKNYFAGPLQPTGAEPLLWTTGLMAPEAYVLKAALDGWIAGEDGGLRAAARGGELSQIPELWDEGRAAPVRQRLVRVGRPAHPIGLAPHPVALRPPPVRVWEGALSWVRVDSVRAANQPIHRR